MADPITVGSLVAAALAMGAEAVVKGTVGEAAKDAYKALKAVIIPWIGRDADALEGNPKSSARQGVIAETIDNLSVPDKELVAALAEELTKHLRAEQRVVGLDVGELETVDLRLRNVTAQSGTGIRFGKVKAKTFEVDGLAVDAPPGKA